MSKLPIVSTMQIVKVLNKLGYSFDRQRGSHLILVNVAKHKIAVVPNRKEVPRGTLRTIIRESGITPEEFLKLLV